VEAGLFTMVARKLRRQLGSADTADGRPSARPGTARPKRAVLHLTHRGIVGAENPVHVP
jgi:hypothetical protein